MRSSYITIFIALIVSGCSGLVASNDGRRVVIQHDGFISADTAGKTAQKSCAEYGKSSARFVNSMNANPSLPKGIGVQLSTFECEAGD